MLAGNEVGVCNIVCGVMLLILHSFSLCYSASLCFGNVEYPQKIASSAWSIRRGDTVVTQARGPFTVGPRLYHVWLSQESPV